MAAKKYTGIIVLGHGTRDLWGQLEFLRFVAALRLRLIRQGQWLPWQVRPAFLELVLPDLQSAVQELYAASVNNVIVLPMFLASAGHMKIDVPKLIYRASQRYPGMRFALLPALGDEEAVAVALVNRIREGKSGKDLIKSGVIVVCRGSTDQGAIENARLMAARVAPRLNVKMTIAASLVGSGPDLNDALLTMVENEILDIIVVPYLLFHGLLLASLKDRIEQFLHYHDTVSIHLASHLGIQGSLLQLALKRLENHNREVFS